MKVFKYSLLLIALLAISLPQIMKAQETADSLRITACNTYKEESGKSKAEYDDEEIDDAEKRFKDKYRDDNPLYKNVILGEDSQVIVDAAIGLAIPWIVLFVFSIIGFLSYMYCCCCPKCACCCKKPEFKRIDILWPLVGVIVFSVYLFFSGIFGAVRGASFLQDFYMIKCSMYSFLADFDTGATTDDTVWLGLTGLKNELEEARADFLDEVKLTFGNTALEPLRDALGQVDTDFLAAHQQQGGLCTLTDATAANFRVVDWDPESNDKGQNTPLSGSAPTATASGDTCIYNYRTQITALTDANNKLIYQNTSLQNQLVVIHNIIAGSFRDIGESISQTAHQGYYLGYGDFATGINDGIDSISSLQDDLNKTAVDFDDSMSEADQYIDTINSVFMAFFVVTLILAVFNGLVAAFFLFKKANGLVHIFNITCCLFMLFTIIGFLLSLIFTIVSEFGFMGCDMMDRVLKNYADFEELGLASGDTADYIKECKAEYGGEGNIVSTLGVDEQLNEMQALKDSMSSALDDNDAFTSGGKADMVSELSSILTNIKNQANKGQATVGGQTTYLIPQADLEAEGTNNTGGRCDNLDLTSDFGSSTAFNMHQIYNGETFDTWNTNGAFTTDCYTNAGENLNVYMNDRYVDLLHHHDTMTTLNGSIGTYFDEITTFMDSVAEFTDNSAGQFLDRIEDILNNKLNCLFLGQNLQNVVNSLCVGLIPAIHLMTENIKVHCFGMFFGSLFIFFARFRLPKYAQQENKMQDVGVDDAVKAEQPPM